VRKAAWPLLSSVAVRRAGACAALAFASLLAFGASGKAAAAAAPQQDVLVLYPYGRLLPGVDPKLRSSHGYGDLGLAAGFAARPDVPITISSEFLDVVRFGGPEQERAIARYIRDKYAPQPPQVIVAVADAALAFVVRHRAELFPQVPVVYLGVNAEFLQSMQPLPPDVVGTPVAHEFVGTIEQARRWHPKARRLVVVTGTSPSDRDWEQRLRAAATRLPGDFAVDFYAGLPIEGLLSRLRGLPADSIVYTPGFFRDGAGRQFEPREVARQIAATAPVPVYGAFATFIGTGVVGGRVASYETMGRVGAETVLALLDGADPAALRPPARIPMPLQLDDRQLRRWGIPAGAVPADAIVQFREPTLWETHRSQVFLGIAVMLLQAGLIVALLLERRRRQRTATMLARRDEHLRLGAAAAGLSPWVLEGDASDAVDVARRMRERGRAAPADATVTDFRDKLARIAPQSLQAVAAALNEARAKNAEFEVEYRIQAPDGTWRWEAARGRADQAQPRRLLGVAIDVTARKNAEIQAEEDRAALYHMTRVSLLGQLSASIAHQLNQPLASILGNAEAAQKMLERDPVDLAELREICADIVAQDHHAAQVIRRLGALFRRGEPMFEPLDLNDLVRDTIELTRSMLTMRHVAAVTQLASTLPPVSGDRVQLQQLLLNLIVNACDAVAEMPDERRVATIQTRADGGVVQLCVADCGAGVATDAIARVFEPFWSTKPRGMGMGLAVCRSIAEAHEGSLAVSNADGSGAVFCLRLPALPAP
jgi:signal transduction histidine kinase